MKYPRLRDLREDAELTQEAVGKYLCCEQNTYSQYERDIRGIPADALVRLALLYKTSTDYILGLTNERDVPWSDWPAKK